ncbi:ricin-type beta-trefoil lectin domain protein [Catenuloplanes sp. NPDC051500]|uniref:ricin-type beta-trefoil lectin domain protein n=1 Tax=Catenuloplanes sp. NPDC051500 TaxID=3363959 RepID=UPI003796CD62
MPNISLRLPSGLSGGGSRATAVLAAGLGIAVLTAAVLGWDIARADDDKITGKAVSDVQLSAILQAAHSCPMASSARLAGQLMAESGLEAGATATVSGGSGIAGIDDEDWKKWAPWENAPRFDITASTLALAHQMCSLSGQVRQAGLSGDSWRLSLAAYRLGLPAVTEAGGVPDEAQLYVSESAGYAAYYADLPQFGGAGVTEAVSVVAGPRAEATPLPDDYVPLVNTAGKVCPEVTSAAVAAELMAATGFQDGRLGVGGRLGVAQFRTDIWQKYAPAGASAWEPASAIPAVGQVLCRLADELDGLEGDPYALALAAFHAGPDTVRRAGGLPDVVTRAFLQKVTDYTEYYRLDSRLNTPPVGPSPSASGATPTPGAKTPTPTPSASAGPSASAPGKPSPSASTSPPAPVSLPGQMIVHKGTGKCLDAGAGTDGTYLTLSACDPVSAISQRWDLRFGGTIVSYKSNLCMDVAWSKVADNTRVQLSNCHSGEAQNWRVADNTIYTNLDANYCLDWNSKETGNPVVIWWCVHHDKQSWTVK